MSRRIKKSQDPEHDEPGREMRRNKLTLFIQQFEKEAQEHMRDLEAKTENLLATVDTFFRVELMKMPPSLKHLRMGDLLSEEEMPASDVSIAMKNEAIEIQQPLRKATRKRYKSTDSPPVQATPAAKGMAQKGGRNTRMRTRTLPESISTGNLRTIAASVKRTESLQTGQSTAKKPKLRSVLSTGDMHCSMTGSSAHISVTTREGQTVCFSENTKDQDINVDLLDDVAWCQIQRLTTLMDHLSSRCQR